MGLPSYAFSYKYTRGKCCRAVLSKRLICWTLEIDESFIKPDVLHFFIFREEVGDLQRDGLKSGDARPGLGMSLGHFSRSWSGLWGKLGASAPHAIWSVQSRHAGDFLTYMLRTMQIWDRGRLLRNTRMPALGQI